MISIRRAALADSGIVICDECHEREEETQAYEDDGQTLCRYCADKVARCGHCGEKLPRYELGASGVCWSCQKAAEDFDLQQGIAP